MNLLAYHKWLLFNYGQNRDSLARKIGQDAFEQNPQTFDLLELTGDKAYNRDTFYKAADILLKADKDGK